MNTRHFSSQSPSSSIIFISKWRIKLARRSLNSAYARLHSQQSLPRGIVAYFLPMYDRCPCPNDCEAFNLPSLATLSSDHRSDQLVWVQKVFGREGYGKSCNADMRLSWVSFIHLFGRYRFNLPLLEETFPWWPRLLPGYCEERYPRQKETFGVLLGWRDWDNSDWPTWPTSSPCERTSCSGFRTSTSRRRPGYWLDSNTLLHWR